MPLINSIVSNTTSLAIRNDINKSNSRISCALERMSSGFKINKVKDDAANSIIATKTDIQLSGLNIANKNAMQGTNLLNVAENALVNMQEKVTRIRDLALQAKNSTLGKDEISAIQKEIDELTAEIKREKETATFNNIKIFDNKEEIKTETIKKPQESEVKPYAYEVEYIESTGTQYIDTGYACSKNDNYKYIMTGDFRGNTGQWSGCNAYTQVYFNGDYISADRSAKDGKLTGNDVITCEYKNITETLNLNGADISSRNWKSYSSSNVKFGLLRLGNPNNSWFNSSAIKSKLKGYKLYKDDELVLDLKPVVDNNGVACMYDSVSGKLFYNQGTGDFIAGDKIEEPPKDPIYESVEVLVKKNTTLQVGFEAGKANTIDIDVGFDMDEYNFSILDSSSASKTLNDIDELIDTLSSRRSKIGSSLNRLSSICELQTNNIQALSSTKSILVDADIAQESANLTQAQILQQISTSLFGQTSNVTKNLAMKLLMFNNARY